MLALGLLLMSTMSVADLLPEPKEHVLIKQGSLK